LYCLSNIRFWDYSKQKSEIFRTEAHFKIENERGLEMTSISSHLPGRSFCSKTSENHEVAFSLVKEASVWVFLLSGPSVVWQ
jgi:hypothetical protein